MVDLPEYAGPRAFHTFATSGRSDTKARAPARAGQCLLACTTEARTDAVDADGPALLELVGDRRPAHLPTAFTISERPVPRCLGGSQVPCELAESPRLTPPQRVARVDVAG